MKRGFTLIEILVVVSIIGMLSSVVVASTAPARARARDSQRILQLRQIDNAVQLYKAKNGHAPDFNGSCAAQASVMNANLVPGCIAISTSAIGANQTAWQSFKNDLAPFMPNIPNDPCGSDCTTSSGSLIGYTYYAPAAIQYSTCNPSCGSSVSNLNDSYSLTAQLERQTVPNNSTYPPPTVSISVDAAEGPDGPVILSWAATNAQSCTFDVPKDQGWDYYNGWVGPIPPAYFPNGSYTFSAVVPATFTFTCVGPGGTSVQSQYFGGF